MVNSFILLEMDRHEVILNTEHITIPEPIICENDNLTLKNIKKGDCCFYINSDNSGHYLYLYCTKQYFIYFLQRQQQHIVSSNNNKCIIFKKIKLDLDYFKLILSEDIEYSKKIYLRDIEKSVLCSESFLISNTILKIRSVSYLYDYQFTDSNCFFSKVELFNIQNELINIGKLLIPYLHTDHFDERNRKYKFFIINLKDISKIFFVDRGISIYNKKFEKIFEERDIAIKGEYISDIIKKLILK